ncbi:ParB N-terminal domain-containing protein [Mariprofundus ferrooxydans]|nr:ParB N-terminal domain-containing protein [Mariprofundus ferrooxydans]
MTNISPCPVSAAIAPVELGSILIHPMIQDAASAQAKLQYAISFTDLSAEAINILLVTQPIIVIKERDRYYCVAGIRTLQAARTRIKSAATVPATLIPNDQLDDSVLMELTLSDIYLKHFTQLMHRSQGKQLASLFRLLGEQTIRKLAPLHASKTAYSRAIGYSRQKLFYAQQNEPNATES